MADARWIFPRAMVLALTCSASAAVSSDPYLWLEEVTGDKALSWVRDRNAESSAALTRLPGFAETNARIQAILDSKDRLPYVSKAGPYYYNFWRDDRYKRGLWRRTTPEEYRKPEPIWETVLDLDALAEREGENWVWQRADFIRPSYDRCLILLSRGGSDATVVREFDPQAKQFVKDGFELAEAKSRVSWKTRDTLFVATDFGPGSLTTSGYPRVVKEWKRGTPLAHAKVVFEGQPGDVSVAASRTTQKGFEREFVTRSPTFFTRELFHRKNGKLIRVEVPDDARAINIYRRHLFVELRSSWAVEGRTFAAGSLLVTDFDAFQKGERRFEVLFEPSARKSLAGLSVLRSGVILNELDNVQNRLYLLTPTKGPWKREPLGSTPETGTLSIGALDPGESDEFMLTATGFLTPPTLYFGILEKGKPEPLKASPSFFKADGLTTTQHEAVSRDGTRIPYFQVSRENLKLDGTNPTLLTGYGGFQLSRLPAYSGAVGAAWLERGGVYVVANLRGGGEFGPTWHQAALKANRHRAYEDCAAVADDLVRRKVTSPKHLGVQGGSNGGLLVGNMLTQYPEKFGAIVCQVPLLDMQRYHKLLAGASWMAEYGNPDLPEEWEFIRTFSPYHNVKKDGKYPRVLFTTSTRDDRVHPGHARKMGAKMREQGHDVLYYENIEGGHGGAADNKQAAFMSALAYTFLWQELK